MSDIKLTFLGTGTSTGVPEVGCPCPVCTSSDPRDRRLRVSVLVETADTRILIDCGPDFREQMLRVPFDPIDGVLLTHEHYDHTGGIDDLRPFAITVPTMKDMDGNALTEPKTPQMQFYLQLPKAVPPLTILRHSVELSAK